MSLLYYIIDCSRGSRSSSLMEHSLVAATAAANRMQHKFEAHTLSMPLCVAFHASLTFAAIAVLQCEMWQVFLAFKSTLPHTHTHTRRGGGGTLIFWVAFASRAPALLCVLNVTEISVVCDVTVPPERVCLCVCAFASASVCV